MNISYADAVEQLKDVKSWNDLRNIINQLDVAGTGTQTVLYSGGFSGDVWAQGIAIALKQSNSSIRIVDSTEAARFLDYEKNLALREVLERLDPLGEPGDHGRNGGSQSESNKFLFNVNYNGQLGAWSTVSHNFVSSPATQGNVRVIGMFADPERVLAQVEVPALMNNPNVTYVDGHSKADLNRMAHAADVAGRDSKGVVLATIMNNSADAVSLIHLPVDTKGAVTVDVNKVPTAIDTTKYFNDGVTTGTPVPEGIKTDSAANLVTAARAEGKVSLPSNIDPNTHLQNAEFANQQLTQYANEQRAAAEAANNAQALAKAEKLLSKLGIVGDALALGAVILQAQAANAAGDSERAVEILKNWAADFTGGIAGAVAGAALANSVLAPMYYFGAIGALVAGGLTIAAGIAGGLLGGDAFAKVINWLLEDDDTYVAPPPPTPPGNYADPLSLDLNGDGTINTLPLSAGVKFDLDNNGFAETTSWVAPVDGLLVLDLNANNKIDGGHELFGTDTRLPNGNLANNGFEALAQYDINADGVISNQDSVFGNLRIWQDANSNGIVDGGELSDLALRNVTAIDMSYISNISTDANGVQHREQGSFQFGDSTSGVTQALCGDLSGNDRLINYGANDSIFTIRKFAY